MKLHLGRTEPISQPRGKMGSWNAKFQEFFQEYLGIFHPGCFFLEYSWNLFPGINFPGIFLEFLSRNLHSWNILGIFCQEISQEFFSRKILGIFFQELTFLEYSWIFLARKPAKNLFPRIFLECLGQE